MVTTSTLKTLSLGDAMRHVDEGAALVDLRSVESYLDTHIPGSVSLLYETGPGFQSRARDCIPLDVPLILLETEGVDMMNAGSSLRGRGFSVPGFVRDGLNEWGKLYGTPTSTDTYRGPRPEHGLVLDVGDPGAMGVDDATRIPIEQLWARRHEVAQEPRVVVGSGYGVRAALAVGILERAGVEETIVWETRA